jgi:hypothetical protein
VYFSNFVTRSQLKCISKIKVLNCNFASSPRTFPFCTGNEGVKKIRNAFYKSQATNLYNHLSGIFALKRASITELDVTCLSIKSKELNTITNTYLLLILCNKINYIIRLGAPFVPLLPLAVAPIYYRYL